MSTSQTTPFSPSGDGRSGRRPDRSRRCAVALLLLMPLWVGCGSWSPNPRAWIGAEVREQYRLVGAVCRAAEEVRGDDRVLLGLELTLTGFGESCTDDARRAFVSVGRPAALKTARRLSIHQQVVAVGTLDGQDRQVLVVERLESKR